MNFMGLEETSSGQAMKDQDAPERSKFYFEMIAHKMKNILQTVLSATDLCNNYLNGNQNLDEIQQLINMITQQTYKGSTFISNIQKLFLIDEITSPIEAVNVSEMLNKTIYNLKLHFKTKLLKIQIISSVKHPLVLANEFLEDVFENLLLNAVVHNSNSAIEVIIKISRMPKDETSYLQLEFIDNGKGIPDDRKPFLFQRQSTKSPDGGGMGLGLSIVQHLVSLYNGTIHVEDKVPGDYSQGSNFIILIPEAPESC
jgi:signal transduction histidine kinase